MKTQRIEKGVQHKYVSRKKVKGRWVYVYPEKKGGKGRHDAGAKVSAKAFDGGFSVGDSFSAGAGKGHWHVKEIKDGQVSYKDDTTGEVKSLSVGDFKKTLLDAHKDAIQTHASDGLKQREAVLEAAKKYGSDKQKARAEKLLGDWKKQHKEYLPKETESKSEAAEAKPSAPKVEIKLATLEGSEKQVKWAEDIRRKALEGAGDFPAQLEDSIAKLQQIYEDPSSELNTTNKARKIQAYISLQLADDLRSVATPILGEMAKQKSAKNWIEGRAALERFSNSTDGRVKMLASFFGSPSRDSLDIPEHAGAWEQLIPYGKPDPAFAEKNKPIEGVLEKLRGQGFAPVSDAWEKIEKLHNEPAPTGQTLKSLAVERKLLRGLHASILGQIGRGGGMERVGAFVKAFHGESMPEAEYNEIKSNPEKAEQQLREKATILRGLFLLSHTNKALQDAGRKLLEGVATSETAKETPREASSESSPSVPSSSEKQPKKDKKKQPAGADMEQIKSQALEAFGDEGTRAAKDFHVVAATLLDRANALEGEDKKFLEHKARSLIGAINMSANAAKRWAGKAAESGSWAESDLKALQQLGKEAGDAHKEMERLAVLSPSDLSKERRRQGKK